MIFFFLSFLRRSEFLGCLSFPILPNATVSGTYLLQPQSCLVNPTPAVLQTSPSKSQLTENSIKTLLADQCSWEHNYHTPAVQTIHRRTDDKQQKYVREESAENIWNQATIAGQSAVNEFLNYLDQRQSKTSGGDPDASDRRASVDPSYKTSFCVR